MLDDKHFFCSISRFDFFTEYRLKQIEYFRMLISDTVKGILQNDKKLCRSVTNTLLKIANNIINHPNEAKFRKINLNCEVIERTLLPAVGALEVLFLMGFEEGSDHLTLPENASLDIVTSYRDQLEQLKRENIPEKTPPQTKGIVTVPKKKKKGLANSDIAQYMVPEAEMKSELEHQFQQVLVFESPRLQEEARNAMPYQNFSKKAKEREVVLKKENLPNKIPLDFQDCILVELLAWFKDDFFSWFDGGYCEPCSKSMKFVGQVSPEAEEREFGGHRVEKYECENCRNVVRFPRYFHPGKLLQTKRGRCMEWASCFTLMCRAVGLDSRYIWDKTDHVWTEVFSLSQNRWIHADPCENKLDCPLMYEKGWNKKLSYIFAFSKDEIVDCVWRYSADHKAVCGRRTRCREDWLAGILCSMNKERQTSVSEAKKKFLNLRLVKEIAVFFTAPQIMKEGESEGRLSGSLSWRLDRGETSGGQTDDEKFKPFTFIPTEEEIKGKVLEVKYSPSQDFYVRDSSNGEILCGWKAGMFSAENVFRKHENDWKMVYIARTVGAKEGKVKWRFDWSLKPVKLQSVLVVLQHKTFEDGAVCWQICSGDSRFQGNQNGVLDISQDELDGNCTHLELSATLSKGKGDVAWQHAQLFRQEDQDKGFPFYVIIRFI